MTVPVGLRVLFQLCLITPMAESVSEELLCGGCLEICKSAVETECCGRLLCQECTNALCPYCGAQPIQYHVSRSIRRIIDSIPVDCVCGAKVQRGNLPDHEKTCPLKVHHCANKTCNFAGIREEFLSHITFIHPSEAISSFSLPDPVPDRDCIEFKGHAKIGWTGKYYCGNSLSNSCWWSCWCCDGMCGPGDGCNCESCMKLDIEARALPKGYLVNREGRISRVGKSGKWHCGAKVMDKFCKGRCGPDSGSQCRACLIVQSQLRTRYTHIVATWQ